jgi:hypothetical protein
MYPFMSKMQKNITASLAFGLTRMQHFPTGLLPAGKALEAVSSQSARRKGGAAQNTSPS